MKAAGRRPVFSLLRPRSAGRIRVSAALQDRIPRHQALSSRIKARSSRCRKEGGRRVQRSRGFLPRGDQAPGIRPKGGPFRPRKEDSRIESIRADATRKAAPKTASQAGRRPMQDWKKGARKPKDPACPAGCPPGLRESLPRTGTAPKVREAGHRREEKRK